MDMAKWFEQNSWQKSRKQRHYTRQWVHASLISPWKVRKQKKKNPGVFVLFSALEETSQRIYSPRGDVGNTSSHSYLVTHPSWNPIEQGLTLLSGQDAVLSSWYYDCPEIQLFRERLSNKTVRDNAERHYGLWRFMVLDCGFRCFCDIEGNSRNKCIYAFCFLVV